MTPERIYFDLDGTLVDPAVGVTRCIRYALDKLEHACPPDEELHTWIGPPLRDSFSAFVGEDRADEAVALYRDRYRHEGIGKFKVYAGIPETLALLRSKDFTLAVATSKPHVFAEQVLRLAGLDDYFAGIYGAELDGRHSDKRELLKAVQANVGNPNATMIGDRHFDVRAARANRLTAIGVLWGYGSSEELADADLLVDTPDRLARGLENLS